MGRLPRYVKLRRVEYVCVALKYKVNKSKLIEMLCLAHSLSFFSSRYLGREQLQIEVTARIRIKEKSCCLFSFSLALDKVAFNF